MVTKYERQLKNVGVPARMRCFISVCRKLSGSGIIYAGLFVCLVQHAWCQTDWSTHLTFENIFNNTNYAQLRYIQKPYYVPVSSIRTNHSSPKLISYNDARRGNEVDGSYSESPLLVGIARDPFRYSVPEADYLKGVRSIDEEYMSRGENRGKRGVLHLYNMLQCATGCDPLSYKGYGCYCGIGGSGRPTDGIDRCCQLHDNCYENVYCPLYTVYLQPYFWKCYQGEPLCALENFQTRNQIINGCSARLCDCDRRFAMCVRRYRCPRGSPLCRSSPLRLLQNLLLFR